MLELSALPFICLSGKIPPLTSSLTKPIQEPVKSTSFDVGIPQGSSPKKKKKKVATSLLQSDET
jgi:hypothetical protein